jgi:hypothetical protein
MTVTRALSRSLQGMALIAITACGSDGGIAPLVELQRLANARELWIGRASDDYEFTYDVVCFCRAMLAMRITVVDGAVASVRPVGSEEALPASANSQYRTIVELFGVVADGLERRPHRTNARYDPVLGFPADVFFDFERDIADEEWGFLVRDVTFP